MSDLPTAPPPGEPPDHHAPRAAGAPPRMADSDGAAPAPFARPGASDRVPTAAASSVADAAAPAGESHPPLPVLFLDEDFVAVSKPSGLLVHRDEHHPTAPAALQTVRDQLQKHLYPFHRLDRATSGILLFGFSRRAAAALQESLAAPDARKEYAALLRYPGSDAALGPQWTCDRPLHDDKDVARACRTDFAVLEEFDRCALVQCLLHSGRYHQIRRHANHCGRHVLGDTTHGKGRINAFFRERFGLDRLFLHLQRVVLRHPRTGEPLELVDPLPAALAAVLDRLRQAPRAAAADPGPAIG